jgi:hypothetical protein
LVFRIGKELLFVSGFLFKTIAATALIASKDSGQTAMNRSKQEVALAPMIHGNA